MADHISDSFYISDNKDAHRVSSISYSQDGESISTFCGEDFKISDENDIINVPIRLLDYSEICVECQRNYSHIQHNRFNFGDSEGEYKFFIRATIRIGDNKGFVVQETLEANSVEDAKTKISEEYEMAEIHKFNYISRSDKYGEWNKMVDNRQDFSPH